MDNTHEAAEAMELKLAEEYAEALKHMRYLYLSESFIVDGPFGEDYRSTVKHDAVICEGAWLNHPFVRADLSRPEKATCGHCDWCTWRYSEHEGCNCSVCVLFKYDTTTKA